MPVDFLTEEQIAVLYSMAIGSTLLHLLDLRLLSLQDRQPREHTGREWETTPSA